MDMESYFIVNPAADTGRLRQRWSEFQPQIEQIIGNTIEVGFTEYPTHAIELAREAAKSGYKIIYSAGGDGTANEVGNAILQHNLNITLGILPGGTTNDFHNAHRFNYDLIETFKAMQEGKSLNTNVGKLTGDFGEPYYFLTHSGCGIGANTSKAARDGSKFIKGEIKYTYYAIKSILKQKNNPGTLKLDGKEFNEEFTMIAAGMTDLMAGYNIWPGNYSERGEFAVMFSYGQSKMQLLKLLLAAEKGEHIKRDGVGYMTAKKVEISLDNPWCFQAEGEIFTDASREVTMEIIPDRLPVLIPQEYSIPKK
ncbi:MAG: YegS/Rv2252/BmrU family lipid kinase [Candidatus Heimdallarchaeota archaeon]|nr:YegS/Rv2252/BmrU family lipid kinase [Candidatus Heimdallarchaeota archaeon]